MPPPASRRPLNDGTDDGDDGTKVTFGLSDGQRSSLAGAAAGQQGASSCLDVSCQ